MTDTIKYIVRASSMTTHQDCRRKWAVQHLKNSRAKKATGEDDDTTKIGAIIGTHAHKAAERLQIAKMEGVDLDYRLVIEQQCADYRKACEGKPLEFDSTTRSQGDGELQLEMLTTEFANYVLPTLNPAFVELELLYEYNERLAVSMHIDVVDHPAYGWYIGDHKFGHGDGAYQVQLGLYTLGLEAMEGFDIEVAGAFISHIQRVGVNATQTRAERIDYSRDQVVDAALMQLEDLDRELLNYDEFGTLWPFTPNPASMFCHESSCDAWGSGLCNQWTPKNKKEKRQ